MHCRSGTYTWHGIAGPASLRLHESAASNLLNEFHNVFNEPQGLPPPCSHDHDINLLRGAALVGVHPYRSLAHKDDL